MRNALPTTQKLVRMMSKTYKRRNDYGVNPFGYEFKRLRNSKGLPISRFAEAAKVSISTVQQIEVGYRRPPKPEIIGKWIEILGEEGKLWEFAANRDFIVKPYGRDERSTELVKTMIDMYNRSESFESFRQSVEDYLQFI